MVGAVSARTRRVQQQEQPPLCSDAPSAAATCARLVNENHCFTDVQAMMGQCKASARASSWHLRG